MSLSDLKKALSRRSKKIGSMYVFQCTKDIISGYALDCPLGSMYLWNFIIPTYDDHEFLHLSLGKRIFYDESDAIVDKEVIDIIDRDWSLLGEIKTPSDLLRWINEGHFGGPYEQWARLLTLCRLGRLSEAAEIARAVSGRLPISDGFAERYSRLMSLLNKSDSAAVGALLDRWASSTKSKFCQ